MKKLMMLGVVALTAALAVEAEVAIKFELPAPHSSGTPKEVKSDNLEPDPGSLSIQWWNRDEWLRISALPKMRCVCLSKNMAWTLTK